MPTKIKCPTCGKVMAINTPDKPGTYKVKCTGCGKELKFKIGAQSAAAQAPASQSHSIGEFEVLKTHQATCPLCGRFTSVRLQKRGEQQVRCEVCSGMLVAVGTPAKTVFGIGGFTGDMRRGIIRVHKSGLGKMFGSGQQMMLRPGPNIIGRADRTAPSDFNLDDRAVSRRSVEIFVDANPVDGFTFRFTVLKSVNPVYHNGNMLNVGDSLALRFGDTIRLGTTTLDFIPEHK